MASANNHLIFNAAFLLALIFSHGIISTEQRRLLKKYEPISAGKSPCVASVSAQDAFRPLTPGHSLSPPDVPRVLAESDGFRPTTPGHSPGAGHQSTERNSVGPN